ncbi:MAG: large conductance mechanosensitive channel protein MscL [Ilumatobacteraceae bacterium]|nr:large conductance mechanosensitive channel protein MscL [Acidimicrobiales bacterium]MCB9395904.1 large conductance mechanosensitive channel protein MscL [Acidimicrobiaceae bacterium]
MTRWIREFRDFISGGNMVELAVAVILGAAIGRVITAFTDGIMMNLVAAIVGEPNFDEVRWKISDRARRDASGEVVADATYLELGRFLTAFTSLVLTGLVLFAVVKSYNRFRRRADADDAADAPAAPTEVELLTEIRDALTRR